MQFRCVLLLLAFTFLDGAAPLYAALGDAPRCLLPPGSRDTTQSAGLNPPIPVLKPALADYDSGERDYLIRTIVFEASGESVEGKAAVAHVILNRKKLGKWGDNIKEVVTRPWQFEPWMTRRKEMESLSEDDSRYQKAAAIADAVLSGQTPDPTAGATHFLNPTIVRQRRGGSLPPWAQGAGQPIGRHTFYSPHESGAGPSQALIFAEMAASSTLIPPGASAVSPSEPVDDECRHDAIAATSPAIGADKSISRRQVRPEPKQIGSLKTAEPGRTSPGQWGTGSLARSFRKQARVLIEGVMRSQNLSLRFRSLEAVSTQFG